MFKTLATHVRGNLIGYIALFIALGGTAYAATAAKNSVTSKSIRTAAVRSPDVKNNGIKGVDVAERTLDISGLAFASAFKNPQDPLAPATPDTTTLNGQYSHTFVTPRRGRLLVYASLRHLAVKCSVGNGNAFLYLDGVGVPGSGQVQPDIPSPDPFTPIALSRVVPAGSHTLRISLDCPMGNSTGDSSSGDGDLGAILIGS